MPLGPQQLSTLSNVLREKWMLPAREAFTSATVTLSLLNKNPSKISGRRVLIPIVAGRGRGGGPRGETGVGSSPDLLPQAGAQRYEQGETNRAHYYQVIEHTGPALAAGLRDGSIFPLLKKDMDGALRDMRLDINRDVFGSGDARLGKVTAINGNDITCDTVKHIEEEMQLVFATSTGTSAVQALVLSVDELTNIITVDTSLPPDGADVTGITNSDFIFPEGVNGTTSEAYNNALDGFANIFGDGSGTPDGDGTTYAGINRSTAGNSFWKALVVDANKELAHEQWLRTTQAIEKRGGQTKIIITSDQQWANFGIAFFGARTWQSNIKTLDPGWQALDFFGKSVVWDKDCPDDRAYFLDTDSIEFAEEEPLNWIDTDGSVFTRQTRADKFEAWLVYRLQLICTNPRHQAMIHDLPTSALT